MAARRLLLRRALLLAMVGVATVAVGASQAAAAVQIGQTSSTAGTCSVGGTALIWQGNPTAPTYVVPAGGGVITSWSTYVGGTAGTTNRLEVIRPGSPNVVVGESDTQSNLPTGRLSTFPTRIPVQGGDIIGLEITGTPNYCLFASPGDTASQATDYGPGSPLPASTPVNNQRVNVSAMLEPDADADGYGDETQDLCPTDPSTHAACQADLSVTKTADRSTATVGDTINYTVAVKNNSTYNSASAVTVTDALPTNVKLLSATASTGSCSGSVSCSLGSLAKGASATVTVSVRATAAGPATDSAQVTSTTADPNQANNTASASTAVAGLPTTLLPFRGVSLKAQTLTVSRRGTVALRISCPSSSVGACVGTDTLILPTARASARRPSHRPKSLRLGSKGFSVPAGSSAVVTIKLSKGALRLLTKKRSLRATETVVAKDARGLPKRTSVQVRIKRRSRR